MKILTVLCHGTVNSTDTDTSEGNVLVITKVAQSLDDFDNFKLYEGVGTDKLQETVPESDLIRGIIGGKGVEAVVDNAVAWIRQRRTDLNDEITVNLAGHSRGSITCYKIARALCSDPELFKVQVNIFAIDPVPGNTGDFISRNGANYENIILGGNVWEGNSFLMLAESEHRVVFRPYIDALYGVGLPNHEFDTMPGTHGGINMLLGYEREAASLVLSRALTFLQANGSPLKPKAADSILDAPKRLKVYAKLMDKVGKYKAHASVNPFKKHGNFGESMLNFVMSGMQVDRHRITNVNGSKADFAMAGGQDGPAGQANQRRKDFHGLTMSEALNRMAASNDGGPAYTTRAQRFFCNLDHETIFRDRYPKLAVQITALEMSRRGELANSSRTLNALDGALSEFNDMELSERQRLLSFLDRQKIRNTILHIGH
ncbi:MAG: hypothetical protein HY020_16240 [Burkholderiales bacterium]|nr:hypothetical protein [Burkholderiales bacterium]